MKITGIRTFLMQAGAPEPKHWASDTTWSQPARSTASGDFRNWLFVKIDTDEGITGVGECSGWPRVIENTTKLLDKDS